MLPIAEAARAVIELTIRAHAIDPELHRVLTEQVPRIGKLARLRELDEICHRMVAGLLAARQRRARDSRSGSCRVHPRVDDRSDRSSRRAALSRSGSRDPRLVDETTLLVTRYLGVAAN